MKQIEVAATVPTPWLKAPLEALYTLKPSMFLEAWGEPSHDGLNDCHEISGSLIADLFVLKLATGWTIATARRTTFISGGNGDSSHSWCEFNGCAIDTTSGRFVVMPIAEYVAFMGATGIERRNARQFRREVERLSKRFKRKSKSPILATQGWGDELFGR